MQRVCRRAMEITEVTLGKDHLEYSIRLDALAGLLVEKMRTTVSCNILGAEVAERRELTLENSLSLSCTSAIEGGYNDAELLYSRALEITEAALGKEHPNVSAGFSNLTRLLPKQVIAMIATCTLSAHEAGMHSNKPFFPLPARSAGV